ncbi:hypothetical protein D3C72_1747290 [compost metagenome]
MAAQRLGLLERARGFQLRKIAASALVLHHDVVGAHTIGGHQAVQQIHRILARIRHVPEVDRHPHAGHQRHQVRVVHPARQRGGRLGSQIDDDMGHGAHRRLCLVHAGNRIEPFVGINHHRCGVVGVKPGEGGVRAVGVKAGKSAPLIDEILRQ